jgi:hypothetical protein
MADCLLRVLGQGALQFSLGAVVLDARCVRVNVPVNSAHAFDALTSTEGNDT